MKKSAFATASAVMALSLGLAGVAEAATIRVVVLTGQEAPGTGGAVFSDFDTGRPALNDSGEVAFYAELEGPGVTAANDAGIFTSGALVARTGDPAPGAGGAVYASFGNEPALNNAGETAFRARLTGPGVTPGNNRGVFTSGALVARDGDAAPGIGGAIYSQGAVPFGHPSLNDAGQVAFTAVVDGPGVTLDNQRGIFASGALVERTGNVAPGTGGAEFLFLGRPTLTNSGETAFYGTFSDPGPGTPNRGGIFSEGGVLVQQGDAVPGVEGAVFTTISSERPALNDAGELAFVGLFEGPGVTDETNIGLFGSGALVAREGDLAPGAGGATFFPRLEPVGLNNAGDRAFQGRLRGAGITDDNDGALFTMRGGAFEMILREGDLLDIGGGELRPILSFQFGGQSSFNDNGDIAFFAELGPIAGGGGVIGIGPGAVGQGISGIFVYEADRIPPPSVVPLPPAVGLMMVGMGALGAIGRRRGGRGGPLRPATHAGLGSRLTAAPRAPERVSTTGNGKLAFLERAEQDIERT